MKLQNTIDAKPDFFIFAQGSNKYKNHERQYFIKIQHATEMNVLKSFNIVPYWRDFFTQRVMDENIPEMAWVFSLFFCANIIYSRKLNLTLLFPVPDFHKYVRS